MQAAAFATAPKPNPAWAGSLPMSRQLSVTSPNPVMQRLVKIASALCGNPQTWYQETFVLGDEQVTFHNEENEKFFRNRA